MKVGFIGCGNMASAIIEGVLKSKMVEQSDILVSYKRQESKARIQNTLGVRSVTDNKEVAKFADVLVLAVKPMYYESVLKEVREVMAKDVLLVSIAPGKTLAWFEQIVGEQQKVVRTMPNTPSLVGAGMTGICYNKNLTDMDKEVAKQLFLSIGKCEEVEERLMDTVVAVSGSSPAYVFMFMEAMADAAVADGMPRSLAYEFAAQAVLGSAKMLLDTKKHPGELKDMVCSPGGTTIAAVKVLEEKGLRSAVIEAMGVCADKARGM